MENQEVDFFTSSILYPGRDARLPPLFFVSNVAGRSKLSDSRRVWG